MSLNYFNQSLVTFTGNYISKYSREEIYYTLASLICYRYMSDRIKSCLERKTGIGIGKDCCLGEIGYYLEKELFFDSVAKQVKAEQAYSTLRSAFDHLCFAPDNRKLEQVFKQYRIGMNMDSDKWDDAENGPFLSDAFRLCGRYDVKDSDKCFVQLSEKYLTAEFVKGECTEEIFTPQFLVDLMLDLILDEKQSKETVYDPFCGSGSFLLSAHKKLQRAQLFAQEKNINTYQFAQMNLFLSGLSYRNYRIECGDSLDQPEFRKQKFDFVVANPPFSMPWSADNFFDDERFSDYEVMAPRTRADYAFIQHMLFHLKEDGHMIAVLPHGVLFRGGAEGTIRKKIVSNNWIDAVIGLPENLFQKTKISTVLVVFRKNKETDKIFFIDASREFVKEKRQNRLSENNQAKILQTYFHRKDIENFSRDVEVSEIENNEYMLNISRYIEAERQEEFKFGDIRKRIEEIDRESGEIEELLSKYLKEFGLES